METVQTEARLQQSLTEIARLLERHRVLEIMTQRQEGPRRDLLESLQHRQNLAELHKRLHVMHPADIAYVLESLPIEDRRTVWEQIDAEQAAWVFVEVSPAVRESLVEAIERGNLLRLLTSLDPDDLVYVSASIPQDVLSEASRALAAGERSVFEDSIQYEDDSVGRYMTREWVAVSEGHTVQQVLSDLRQRGSLPAQTDRIFVTDARNVLRGTVTLPTLLLQEPSAPVLAGMAEETTRFHPDDKARDAVRAFERYDLVSAPVIDERGKSSAG